MLDALLSGSLYPHGLKFERLDAYPAKGDGIVLVVPGRYWADDTAAITEAVSRYRWVLAFRCGDEEDLFDIAKVEHPNVRWWVQTPRTGRDYGAARLFGVGFTPHLMVLPPRPPEKTVDLFLSAQQTHSRRQAAFDALAGTQHMARVHATTGFTHGLQSAEYAQQMRQAKIAPAPSGAVSPDSFRLWEALQAHCVPIADAVSPVDGVTQYWSRLFDSVPFPVIENYNDLPGWIDDQMADWPRAANRIAAWWMREKRAMAHKLRDDLKTLGADVA
jgi:hypothetical protein